MSKFAQYILAASPIVVYSCKVGGDYAPTYVSENIFGLLGYTSEQFLDDPAFWKNHLHPDDRERVLADLSALHKDRHQTHEYRFKMKSGDYRWMRDELRLVRNPETGSDEIVGSWLDITERKQTEERLRESEERLRKITEAAQDAILMMDSRGAISYWNAAAEAMLGYRPEEALGKDLHSLLAPERYLDRQRAALPDFQHTGRGEAVGRTLELAARRKDGEEIDVSLSLSSILLHGEWHAIGILRDITERKRAEDELRHSHELLKYIIEHTRSAVAVHDRELRYLYVSQRYLDEYDVKERNVIGRHHYEVFPDLPQKWRDVHQRALNGEVLSAEEDPYVRMDGSVDWTRWECRPWYQADGSVGGIIVYTEVITKRKRMEEALRDSEGFLREAARIAKLGRWRSNPVTGELECSSMMREIFGLTSPERKIGYEDFFAAVHAADRSAVEATVRDALERADEFSLEHRIVRQDGSTRHVQARGKPYFGPDGKPLGTIGTILDVTEQKLAEERLREADRLRAEALQQAEFERDKTKAILEAMADGISIQDPGLRVLYQNAAHRNRMGDHLGEFCYQAYQQRDDVCPGCHLVQSFADGQVHSRQATAAPGGEPRYFEIVSAPLFDPSGKVVAGIESVRDITERKQAEEELRQKTLALENANSELETFSYTLSHDLRSYLSRISLAGESLQIFEDERLDDNGRNLLQMIVGTCQSMDDLIATMLTLAHVSRQEMNHQDVNLSLLAEQICSELAAAEPGRALHFDIAPDIHLAGDAQLLRVALENLLGNACKYTRGKAEARISLKTAQKNGRLAVAISDNGAGFDMAEAEKLFRPFHRLSSARSFPGFGIGLTTVQRIVQRHGGEIWAEAAPGEGATFWFALQPATE